MGHLTDRKGCSDTFVFDVGGALQRGTSPFDPNSHQLLVEGGKLWVGSRFMDTVNNGAAWTIPPAAPKGGWTSFGRVITPGDPFKHNSGSWPVRNLRSKPPF